jgi:uncharacterized protein YjbJ (UPF0337 family)
MNWSIIEQRWNEYRASAKRQWDKLSEQQINGTRGKREYLASRVREAYSLTKEEAERQVAEWQDKLVESPR